MTEQAIYFEPAIVYPALALAGFVAGVLNVVAGGGSFLTLPILIFFGLPPGVANGTNRVAILLQNAVASWGFHRHGVLDPKAVLWAALPATAGAGLGAWAALSISDDAFRRLLAALMVVVTLWTLISRRSEPKEQPASLRVGMLAVGFFGVGIYGGFVQAGVGFFILAATSLAGLDLVRGNAVKVLSILCFSALSLAVFALSGKVDWTLGLALAVGNMAGGWLGVRLTVLKGHVWIGRVVTVTVIVFAIRLWFG